MKNRNHKSSQDELQTRRRALKRLALLGAIAIVPAVLGSSGCQTMKNAFGGSGNKKESKTIDDVLSEKRPGW